MQKLDDEWYYFSLDDNRIGSYTGQQLALKRAKSWAEGWLVYRFLPVSETLPAGEFTIYAIFCPSGVPLRVGMCQVVSSHLEEAQEICPENHLIVQYTLDPLTQIDKMTP